MRVISLWQPFASLIFVGAKTYETRPMKFPVKMKGTFIGLHATAKFTPKSMISPELDRLCIDLFGNGYRDSLPRSAILGIVRLDACHGTDDLIGGIDTANRLAGDWTPGRYAWELGQVTSLPMAMPAKGNQGWWEHEPLNFELVNTDIKS
jgi:hypothetical protein